MGRVAVVSVRPSSSAREEAGRDQPAREAAAVLGGLDADVADDAFAGGGRPDVPSRLRAACHLRETVRR